jgi:hypothetical protein
LSPFLGVASAYRNQLCHTTTRLKAHIEQKTFTSAIPSTPVEVHDPWEPSTGPVRSHDPQPNATGRASKKHAVHTINWQGCHSDRPLDAEQELASGRGRERAERRPTLGFQRLEEVQDAGVEVHGTGVTRCWHGLFLSHFMMDSCLSLLTPEESIGHDWKETAMRLVHSSRRKEVAPSSQPKLRRRIPAIGAHLSGNRADVHNGSAPIVFPQEAWLTHDIT